MATKKDNTLDFDSRKEKSAYASMLRTLSPNSLRKIRRYGLNNTIMMGISNIEDKIGEGPQEGSNINEKSKPIKTGAVENKDFKRTSNEFMNNSTSMFKVIKDVNLEMLSKSTKMITTAGSVINKQLDIDETKLIGKSLAKSTPIIGYFVSKLIESPEFKNAATGMAKFTGNVAKGALSSIGSYIKSRPKNEKEDKSISKKIVDSKKKVPSLADGGYVKKGGLVNVHAGEVVGPIEKVLTANKEDAKSITGSINSLSGAQKETSLDLGETITRGTAESISTLGNTFVYSMKGMENTFNYGLKMLPNYLMSWIRPFMESMKRTGEDYYKDPRVNNMDKMVSAIVDLRTTLVGYRSMWERLKVSFITALYKHPAMNTFLVGMGYLVKATTFPFRWLFKKRGLYTKDLPTKGSPQEKTATTLGLLYSGLMDKSDKTIQWIKDVWIGFFGDKAQKDKLKAEKKQSDQWTIFGTTMRGMWQGGRKLYGKAKNKFIDKNPRIAEKYNLNKNEISQEKNPIPEMLGREGNYVIDKIPLGRTIANLFKKKEPIEESAIDNSGKQVVETLHEIKSNVSKEGAIASNVIYLSDIMENCCHQRGVEFKRTVNDNSYYQNINQRNFEKSNKIDRKHLSVVQNIDKTSKKTLKEEKTQTSRLKRMTNRFKKFGSSIFKYILMFGGMLTSLLGPMIGGVVSGLFGAIGLGGALLWSGGKFIFSGIKKLFGAGKGVVESSKKPGFIARLLTGLKNVIMNSFKWLIKTGLPAFWNFVKTGSKVVLAKATKLTSPLISTISESKTGKNIVEKSEPIINKIKSGSKIVAGSKVGKNIIEKGGKVSKTISESNVGSKIANKAMDISKIAKSKIVSKLAPKIAEEGLSIASGLSKESKVLKVAGKTTKGVGKALKFGAKGLGKIASISTPIIDGYLGGVKAKEWGVSKKSAQIGGAIGGTEESGIVRAGWGAWKWGAIAASIAGSVAGVAAVLGAPITIPVAAIGATAAAIGAGISGYGGKRIAKKIDEYKKPSTKYENMVKKTKDLKSKTSGILSNSLEKAKDLKSKASKKFTHGLEKAKDLKSKVSESFSNGLEKVKDKNFKVPSLAEGGVIKKTGLVNVHAGEAVGPLDKIIEGVKDKYKSVKNKVSDGFTSIGEKYKSVKNKGKEIYKSSIDKISPLISSMSSGVKSGIESVKDKYKSIKNKVFNTITPNSKFGSVKDILSPEVYHILSKENKEKGIEKFKQMKEMGIMHFKNGKWKITNHYSENSLDSKINSSRYQEKFKPGIKKRYEGLKAQYQEKFKPGIKKRYEGLKAQYYPEFKPGIKKRYNSVKDNSGKMLPLNKIIENLKNYISKIPERLSEKFRNFKNNEMNSFHSTSDKISNVINSKTKSEIRSIKDILSPEVYHILSKENKNITEKFRQMKKIGMVHFEDGKWKIKKELEKKQTRYRLPQQKARWENLNEKIKDKVVSIDKYNELPNKAKKLFKEKIKNTSVESEKQTKMLKDFTEKTTNIVNKSLEQSTKIMATTVTNVSEQLSNSVTNIINNNQSGQQNNLYDQSLDSIIKGDLF